MALAFSLLVIENFRPAEIGYVTSRGVRKLTGGGPPIHAISVKARSFVAAGTFGLFDAVERPRPGATLEFQI